MRIMAFALAFSLGLITFDGFAQVRISEGCERSNAQGPRSNVAGLGTPWLFYTGEKLTWSVTTPKVGSPTLITLTIDSVDVDSTSFPGKVSYVFPADRVFDVKVKVNSGWATFDATCEVLQFIPATPVPSLNWQGITILITLLASFAYYLRRRLLPE